MRRPVFQYQQNLLLNDQNDLVISPATKSSEKPQTGLPIYVQGSKEAEIQKVKINTKADFIYSLESSTSVANLFGSYLVRGDLNPLLSYEEDINKVSAKQVQEIAKKYFDFSKSTTLILKK